MTDLTGIPADAATANALTGPDRSGQFNTFFAGAGKQKIVVIDGGFDTGTGNGGYHIGAAPVLIPHGTSIQGTGRSARIFVNKNANKPLFGINTDGNGTITDNAGASNVGPGFGNTVYRDFFITGSFAVQAGNTMADCPVFEVGNSATIENMDAYNVQTLVRSPNGVYLDQLTIRKCVVSGQPSGSGFAVDLGAATRVGDGLVIDQLHVVLNTDSVNRPRALVLRNARGGNVINGINGDHEFYACAGIRFSGFHGESGRIIFNGTHGIASDNVYWMHDSPQLACTPLNFAKDANYGDAVLGNMKFERQMFFYQEGSSGFTYDTVQNNISVESSAGYLEIEDCYASALSASGSPVPVGKAGVKTGDATFDAYSHFASVHSTFDTQKWLISADHGALGGISSTGAYVFPNGAQQSLSRPDLALGEWNLDSDTYYFKVVPYLDLPRKIGANTVNEVTLDLIKGSTGKGVGAARIYLDVGRGPKWLRVYIGTTSGVYDRYIDIPWVAGNYIGVQGNRIMGYPAVMRTPGGIDGTSGVRPQRYALRPGDQANAVAYGNVSVWNFESTMPGQGTWNQGDEVNWVFPAGGKRGYRRLTNGSGHVLGTDWVALTA
jgi:hypothetical protein